MADDNSNIIAALIHVSGIVVGFIGPLIAYLVVKDAKLKEHSKNALNFQITMTVAIIVVMVISFILMFVLIGFLTMLLVPLLGLADLVLVIIAAVKAAKGETWKYPLTVQLIK